jgi:hypothetical protein
MGYGGHQSILGIGKGSLIEEEEIWGGDGGSTEGLIEESVRSGNSRCQRISWVQEKPLDKRRRG